jgi:hypothetical protein
MKLQELHPKEKDISANVIFKDEERVTKSIHLSKGAELSKHQSKTPALLICKVAKILFENEKGVKETRIQSNFVNIQPQVNHCLTSVTNSDLLLIN